jgi:hypothetical protein
MADSNNPGQFGDERDDTEEQARQGGENSGGRFDTENGADPQEAGEQSAAEEPREAGMEEGQDEDTGEDGESDQDNG